uniref:Transmembrane protein 134 n=1 Tax=Macaca fascicularis TaxID=9541 RepID=A0A7N9IBK1_MACFA
MSAARPQFSIDDAFELSLEDAGPGPEASGVARFGPLHFERRARFEVADEDKQSRLRYQPCPGPPSSDTGPQPAGKSPQPRPRSSSLNSSWGTQPIPYSSWNLENDEDGAQISPEPDGGVSTRLGPGIPAELPSAAPSGPLAPSAAAPSAPTTPAAAGPNTL